MLSLCNCKNPHEHAKHLQVEASLSRQLFREPIKYFVTIPASVPNDQLPPIVQQAIRAEVVTNLKGEREVELTREEFISYMDSRKM